MAENVTLARPYARAAFELARDAGQLAEWSVALGNMAATAENENLKPLLNDPAINPGQISEIIVAACGLSDGPMVNFVRLLAEGRRLPTLVQIAAQFEIYRSEEEKTIDVEVSSAAELNEAQQQRLAESLQKRLGRSVRLHVTLDESLLGGAVVKAGDLVIDGSVRTRLSQLTQSIMS
ncbi:MAG: F0F1 ATP synthase subunit delta [Gammaproteobacteria bacterium]|nr:F0F1 ATP synthase subunit delta [Gammaproteobacteria bacterium]